MPKNTKSEADDFRFPKTVVNASDFNKHDEEIIAIEKAIGINRQEVQTIPGDGDTCHPITYGLKENLEQILIAIESIPESISQ
jgi:hypothetical protein